MDVQKVDMFIMSKGDYFPYESLFPLREKLLELDDDKWEKLSFMEFKNPTTALCLSLLVYPVFGLDRFYVGDIGLGFLKCLTMGGCGLLVCVDWFLIMGRARRKNLQKLQLIL